MDLEISFLPRCLSGVSFMCTFGFRRLVFGFLCSFWLLGLGSSLTVCVLRNAYLGSLVGRGSLYLNQLSPEWRSLSLKAVPTLGLVRGLTGRDWPLLIWFGVRPCPVI